ncbi:hypothetical protein CEXT_232641 [Caerostris extrusa]|uniref:Uncharacterized protein n=1 Tax=Caerostris extrusa TaxID=172846 RepID=A0AAV4T9I1_CAEEX|nr:hypothetical protein CEXT_232641 [Caerostris extrusa]
MLNQQINNGSPAVVGWARGFYSPLSARNSPMSPCPSYARCIDLWVFGTFFQISPRIQECVPLLQVEGRKDQPSGTKEIYCCPPKIR